VWPKYVNRWKANNRLTISLDSRDKALDELLQELKSGFPHIWTPLLCGASLLIGIFLGMGIRGWRDSPLTAAKSAMPAAVQSTGVPVQDVSEQPAGNSKMLRHGSSNTASPAGHEG
jgi:hypothetical protein